MKVIFVLLKKELRSLFLNPTFYIIAFLATLLLSITFTIGVYNFAQMVSNSMVQMGLAQQQQKNIHYVVFLQHLSLLNLIFIFLIPAVATRMISEEKKNKTFDLLMTSPIQAYQIVISKYASLLIMILLLTLLTSSYIILSRSLFSFSLMTTGFATLGIFLAGCVYASLSLFASSLTENNLISFFIGIIFNILLWLLGGLTEFADSDRIKSILDQLSLNLHLQSLFEGVVRTNGLIYFGSLIFVFCFLTERVIESVRWRS